MTTTYHPSVHRFAIFVVCWTILLLIAGALVTSNEAALSVPDWPLSYGTLTPPMVGGIRYEHSHRVIAGVLGLLSIVLAVWVWAKDERRWLRWFSVIAVAGIAAQAVLGGEVVRQLAALLVAGHACVLRADCLCGALKHRGLYQPVVGFRSASGGRHRLAFDSLPRHCERRGHLFAGDSGCRLPA